MVYIITGGLNQGKTLRMLSIYKKLKKGDGFITRKIFSDESFIGYDIVRLQTGYSIPFAYKKDHTPADWDEIYKYGSFTFSMKAFRFAEKIITETINRSEDPVFIDEVGYLELQGKGFSDILKKVFEIQQEIYITVRNEYMDRIIKDYKIKDYEVIEAVPKSS